MKTPRPISKLLTAPWFGVAARVLLTLPYWWSGLAKLTDLRGAVVEAQGLGFGAAGWVVAATIVVQLTGSVFLVSGLWGWLGAGALGVFTAVATLIAHQFWTLSDPVARFGALNAFLEHGGLIGGIVLAAILVERSRSQELAR